MTPRYDRLTVTERVVLVPRRGMTATQAYGVASRRLEQAGLVPLQLQGVELTMDELSAVETFQLRIDVAPSNGHHENEPLPAPEPEPVAVTVPQPEPEMAPHPELEPEPVVELEPDLESELALERQAASVG